MPENVNTAIAKAESLPVDRRNPVLPQNVHKGHFKELGRRDRHQIERVVQSIRVDPTNPMAALFQMGNIPQDKLDAWMILCAESLMLPKNRPPDLPENSLNFWPEDIVARYAIARPLMQWSVNGSMVDRLANALTGFVQMLMRPFRRRQSREMAAGDADTDPDSELT